MLIRIVPFPADVAELADAQVSEACDGDIVEVQVLSSAPNFLFPTRKTFQSEVNNPFCEAAIQGFLAEHRLVVGNFTRQANQKRFYRH